MNTQDQHIMSCWYFFLRVLEVALLTYKVTKWSFTLFDQRVDVDTHN